MNFHQINLMEVVANTISGEEGATLKAEVEANLRINQGISIDFKGHGPLSTEFILKSFGGLLQRYGHEVTLLYVKITGTHLTIEDIFCMQFDDTKS